MRRVFLSDVHLTPRDPVRTARLVEFLARQAPRTDELYILGDLFDYWIGPKHLDMPDYQDALDALRAAAGAGVRIVFIQGNRDFYMDGRFARATGVELAPAGTEHRLTIDGRQVYLCHGDYLEGRAGPGFRIQEAIRSRFVQSLFTQLPASMADALARFYRWLSGRKSRRPKASVRHLGPHGLYEPALLDHFRHGVDVIVCGHVHTAQEVSFDVAGRKRTLFTLGDWSDGESYLEEDQGRWRLCGG